MSKTNKEPQQLALEAEMAVTAKAQKQKEDNAAKRKAIQQAKLDAWQQSMQSWTKSDAVIVDDPFGEKLRGAAYKADAARKTATLLAKSGANIYVADGRLVRLSHLNAVNKHGISIPGGTLAVTTIGRDEMTTLIWQRIVCITVKVKPGYVETCAVRPPSELVHALLQPDMWGPFPELRGISTCPQIDLQTGSAHLSEGYDADSKLYYDFGGTKFQDGPATPTLFELTQAADFLRDLISEFPFAAVQDSLPPITDPQYREAEICGIETSRAGVMAMILTAGLLWKCLHPLFAGTAYNPGSGKSTIGTMMACIIDGKEESITYAWPSNKDENEKQLTTVAMQKHPFVIFDNAEGRINAPKLNIIVSEGKLNARLFGKIDKEIQAVCLTLIYINGNALRISDDLIRRTILFCVNAYEERASDSQYKREIEKYTLENREKIWLAIITIIRYSIQHQEELKEKYKIRPFAGFSTWGNIVRLACLACDMQDPVASQDALYAADPARQERESIIMTWAETYGDTDICIADVFAATEQQSGSTESKTAKTLLTAFRDNIPHRGELSVRIVGAWLQRNQKRSVNGQMLVNTGKCARGAFWRLVHHSRPTTPTPPETEETCPF